MNIGFAVTGSFCTHAEILKQIKNLVDKGHNILPIVTTSVYTTSTRFGSSQDFIKNLVDITKNKVVYDLVGAEPIGPKNLIDILVVAPCTGNTLAKLANAVTDNAVTMTAKSLMRNNKPIVIAVSSNDALGLNMKNLATLLNSKNIYFVPMHQDNPQKKPKSLIAIWGDIEETILNAVKDEQIQPLFK